MTIYAANKPQLPAAITSGQALLEVHDIAVVYDDAMQAISDVSLRVPAGTITSLVGANGAGKTTTLRAISNLLIALRGRVTAGRICFDGQDVARLRPSQLVRQGLVQVLEGRHCFPHLTVEENLLTGATARGSTPRESREDLQRVYRIFPRLRERRSSRSGLTSGGEQQMVAIGRALMTRPRLLILDEPSMGLAPLVVRDIFEVLRALNAKEGLSILIAEQNSTLALRYADHIVVVENGRDVLAGSAKDIRENHNLERFYLGEAALTLADPDTKIDPSGSAGISTHGE
ncbi:ABC transporter ATP-binding protein [Cyanobium sp. FGCU-6]|nr:ABC transporter ATP-binding protein [Cyanobium sp. FGCU6]